MGSFIWGENDSKKEIKQKSINTSNICETREYLDENLRLNFRNKSGYCLFVDDKLIHNLTNSNFSFYLSELKQVEQGIQKDYIN